jgi:hypothetical protein
MGAENIEGVGGCGYCLIYNLGNRTTEETISAAS